MSTDSLYLFPEYAQLSYDTNPLGENQNKALSQLLIREESPQSSLKRRIHRPSGRATSKYVLGVMSRPPGPRYDKYPRSGRPTMRRPQVRIPNRPINNFPELTRLLFEPKIDGYLLCIGPLKASWPLNVIYIDLDFNESLSSFLCAGTSPGPPRAVFHHFFAPPGRRSKGIRRQKIPCPLPST